MSEFSGLIKSLSDFIEVNDRVQEASRTSKMAEILKDHFRLQDQDAIAPYCWGVIARERHTITLYALGNTIPLTFPESYWVRGIDHLIRIQSCEFIEEAHLAAETAAQSEIQDVPYFCYRLCFQIDEKTTLQGSAKTLGNEIAINFINNLPSLDLMVREKLIALHASQSSSLLTGGDGHHELDSLWRAYINKSKPNGVTKHTHCRKEK